MAEDNLVKACEQVRSPSGAERLLFLKEMNNGQWMAVLVDVDEDKNGTVIDFEIGSEENVKQWGGAGKVLWTGDQSEALQTDGGMLP